MLEFCIKNTNLDINNQNNYRFTVFHYACQKGNFEII